MVVGGPAVTIGGEEGTTTMGYTESGLRDAIEGWRTVVGVEHVLTGPSDLASYARTTGAGEGTVPGAIVRPVSTEQVVGIVDVARRFEVPVYPISRGKNWGYGDACAPTAGQVVVDLGRMDQIVEVHEGLAYAVIEPGVTQGQLYAHLSERYPGLWMDCTGAGPDASIVGNVLERGFGHTRYGDRGRATCGMRVVLADGRVLDTGFGGYPQRGVGHVYPYGVGPGLDGLFCQSNFGIVTRMGVWLLPKPEAFCAFFFSTDDEDGVSDLVDRLGPLKRAGLLQSAVHIANDLRVISSRARYPYEMTGGKTPLPDDVRKRLRKRWGVNAWNGLGAVYGTHGSVRAGVRAIKGAMGGVGGVGGVGGYRVQFLNDRRLAWAKGVSRGLDVVGLGGGMRNMLSMIEPLYRLLQGRPTREPQAGVGWRVRDGGPMQAVDPLETDAGFLWVSPVLRMDGREARELLGLMEPIYAEHGFEMLVTMTMISERAMVCVTNVSFDRRDKEDAERARGCYDALMQAVLSAGFPPYRVGLDGYEKVRAEGNGAYWDVARALKGALDPGGIISPGRYVG